MDLTITRAGAVVSAVLEGVGAYCGPLNVENVSKSRNVRCWPHLRPEHAIYE